MTQTRHIMEKGVGYGIAVLAAVMCVIVFLYGNFSARLTLLLQQFRLFYILKNPSPQHKTAGKDHDDRRPLGKPSTINRFKLRIYTIPHITTGVEQRACQQRNPFCLLTVNRNYRSSYKIKCN